MLGSRLGPLVGPAAVLTGCVALLSGCGAAADKAAAPTPTPSSTVSAAASETTPPSTSPSPVPTPPAAAHDTKAAREAFVRYVVAAWSYSLDSDDPTPVTDLSPRKAPCQGCADLRLSLHQRRQQHWYVDFPGARVRRVTVKPGPTPGTWAGRAVIDIPASRSYFDDGTFRNDNAAHKSASFAVTLRRDGTHYTLLSFSVG